MSKETKTAEEYYKEFYRLDEQGELTNQDIDIINCMEEYATIRLKAQEEKHNEEMEKLKICTGCGRLSSQKISEGFLYCCPDNNYIPIREYLFHSKYINV